MNRQRATSRHVVTSALVLGLTLLGAPPPVVAQETTSSSVPSPSTLGESVQRLVASTPLAVATAAPATYQQAPLPATVDLGKPSFFKTPTGVIVLGVFAAGTGYALYSISNDRIRGTGR